MQRAKLLCFAFILSLKEGYIYNALISGQGYFVLYLPFHGEKTGSQPSSYAPLLRMVCV